MKSFIVFIFLAVLINTQNYSQSKIEKSESSVKDSEKNSKASKSDNSSDDNLFINIFGEIFIELLANTIYEIAIESYFEIGYPASNAHLSKYPYYNPNKGNYTYDFNDTIPKFRCLLNAKYISENKSIKGSHFNLDMRFLQRYGIEADYLQLWEDNPNFGHDNLAIYTLLAKYYRVRTEKFDAYWGLGTSYFDGNVNQLGFVYGLGVEWFFAKPLSIEANFNQTFINQKTVNKLNGLVNYHINQYKVIGGYEHLKIGSQKFSMATLGLGLYF